MIRLEKVTKQYGSLTAVDGVSFHVAPGEIVGLLGPNGAGKSTTMRMLTGYLSATQGTVRIAGLDVFEKPVEARRHIGYMPESVPLYPEMRVNEYLNYRAAIKGVPGSKRRKRVEEVMERCWLAERSRTLVGHLSKGYRQRVGLADALVASPDLLVLDEPTIGLDPTQIVQVRDLIRGLGAQHTILLSSHILPEVEAVCSRVIIIRRGRIAVDDRIDALKARLQREAAVGVELKAPAGNARPALAAIAGAKEVEELGGSEGWCRFRLRAEAGQDLREPVAALARERDWPLRELHRDERTLEDVFLEAVRAEDVPPKAEAKP